MVHVIVKLGEWYYIWSSVADAFRTAAMSLDELTRYLRKDEVNMEVINERLERVEKYGTSFHSPTSVRLEWS